MKTRGPTSAKSVFMCGVAKIAAEPELAEGSDNGVAGNPACHAASSCSAA